MSITDASITYLYNHSIPQGAIILWSGSQLPTGWVLCDGLNGTPNLSNKFILSADSLDDIGVSGGSYSVSISTTNLPSHNHNITLSGGGSFNHTHNTGNNSANHTHRSVSNLKWDNYTGYFGNSTTFTGSGGASIAGFVTNVSSAFNTGNQSANHTHNVNSHSQGNHTHTVNAGNTGSGTALTLPKPEYYTLAYIMKT